LAKVLLVDDHDWIHDSIRLLLQPRGFDVVGVFSGEQAVEMVDQGKPDVIIMDIRMPKAKLEGIEACRKILNEHTIPVIMFTASSEYEEWWRPYAQAVAAGAIGFVDKAAGKTALLQAVQAALEGGQILDPARVKEASEKWEEFCKKQRLFRQLTRRERQVLKLIRQGKTDREIADDLTLSLYTVSDYVKKILCKLQVSSRAGAAGFEAV